MDQYSSNKITKHNTDLCHKLSDLIKSDLDSQKSIKARTIYDSFKGNIHDFCESVQQCYNIIHQKTGIYPEITRSVSRCAPDSMIDIDPLNNGSGIHITIRDVS